MEPRRGSRGWPIGGARAGAAPTLPLERHSHCPGSSLGTASSAAPHWREGQSCELCIRV